MTISALSAATTACEASGWRLSNLELQKLLFLSHRTFMGRNDAEPIVNEGFEAWDYGPVIPELYRIVWPFGAGRIDALPPVRRRRSRDEHHVIREVVDHFSGRTAGQLVDLTHSPGGAWDRCYVPGRRHTPIPNEYILQEYRRLVDARRS